MSERCQSNDDDNQPTISTFAWDAVKINVSIYMKKPRFLTPTPSPAEKFPPRHNELNRLIDWGLVARSA